MACDRFSRYCILEGDTLVSGVYFRGVFGVACFDYSRR